MAWLILFSLNVRQSLAWRFSFARSSLRHLRRFSSFLRSSLPDQVPVDPADGAVAAAVDPPVVAPPAPAVAAGDKNAQNDSGNVVPAPQPAAPEVSVSLVLVFV